MEALRRPQDTDGHGESAERAAEPTASDGGTAEPRISRGSVPARAGAEGSSAKSNATDTAPEGGEEGAEARAERGGSLGGTEPEAEHPEADKGSPGAEEPGEEGEASAAESHSSGPDEA
mmetsp:Transcript_41408/g.98146  ORF Transcript_41408/g.98146 Transcript_41408/m.98146 type:complete len:119 (-) Transcript_41408:65-421(-)